jgi:alkanesulfonate monooxygenase
MTVSARGSSERSRRESVVDIRSEYPKAFTLLSTRVREGATGWTRLQSVSMGLAEAEGAPSLPERGRIQLFTTCPPSSDVPRDDYLRIVHDVSRWSEDAGIDGILVYSDNRLLDPWMLSHVILQATSTLMPLVAVQPLYVHPFVAAKSISTLAYLYGRRICVNMVAGGFRNDLVALDDETEHDRRYDRLVEYGLLMKELFAGVGSVTAQGRYYKVKNLKLVPRLAEEHRPEFFVSGSSPAGLGAARALGATAVKYPGPSHEETGIFGESLRCGIRVGIIARADAREAWAVAHERFPPDRRGQIAHSMAMSISDSAWHEQLSAMSEESAQGAHPYWLTPFENYKTFCPYLVGSYEAVEEELIRYLRLGYSMLILDVPASRAELDHVRIPIDAAWKRIEVEQASP